MTYKHYVFNVLFLVLGLGAMYTFWLYTDNARLEGENVEIKTRNESLIGDSVDYQADIVYLKEQALGENVFLVDRPDTK